MNPLKTSTRSVIALLLMTTPLLGQDFERVKPKEPTEYKGDQGTIYGPNGSKQELSDGDSVLIPELNGVILSSEVKHFSKEEIERAAGGIEIVNLQIPGKIQQLNRQIADKFLGKPLTKQGLLDLKREIILYYRNNGRPIVTVEIPEQKIVSGVIQIVVIEGKLGKVTAEGNKYFKSSALESFIRLEKGQAINSNTLITDLDWINRNPFRQVDVIYAPGDIAGTTDIRLLTMDRRPWRVYAGVDNTGFDETDTTRIFVGANWGNVFGTEQLLSLQVTTAPNIDRFWAITGTYTIPLPWRDIWLFYGGYSHIHPDMKTQGLDNSGYAAQASTRYNFILPALQNYLHDIVLGFDYKRTDNNIEFGGERIFKNSINLTQFVLGYNSAYTSDYARVSLTVELFYSPGDWLPEQSNSDYSQVRYEAKSSYLYGRMAFAPIIRLPKDFAFAVTLRGQLANQNLLASEQYGLGGYNTVRGYKERQVNADDAFLASAEIRSPALPLFFRKSVKDALQCLAFLDYAIGHDVHQIPDTAESEYLLSCGPGIRYEIGPYINFRGDLGFQLRKLDSKGFRFHFALVASY